MQPDRRRAPPPFSLRQLQYAVAVADALSFRRAAELCHVSQPSLSAQLAELEHALGVRLFERDRRGVVVTPGGREVLIRARRLLLDTQDLMEAGRQLRDPLDGTLRLGVIPTISPYLLPDAVPALRRRHPRLTVLWIEDKTRTLVAGLASGTIDAAVLALEADLGDLEWEVLAKDPFVLAAPAGHALGAGRGPVRVEDLKDSEVLLLDEGHCLRDQALAACGRANVRELSFRATSLPTLAQMVAAGAGVTLLPRLSLATEARHDGIVVRAFADPEPYRTLALVWRKRSPLGPALAQVASAFREVCVSSSPARSKAGAARGSRRKATRPARGPARRSKR